MNNNSPPESSCEVNPSIMAEQLSEEQFAAPFPNSHVVNKRIYQYTAVRVFRRSDFIQQILTLRRQMNSINSSIRAKKVLLNDWEHKLMGLHDAAHARSIPGDARKRSGFKPRHEDLSCGSK